MTAGRFADNARNVAAFMAAFPEGVESPTHADVTPRGASVKWLIFGENEKDQRARAAAIIRGIGGKWDKAEQSDLFAFSCHHVSGVRLKITVNREQVCMRRVVGQETVVKQVPVAFEDVTETVDVVEWDCAPVLAGVES